MDHLFIGPDFRSHFLLSVRHPRRSGTKSEPCAEIGLPEQVAEVANSCVTL